MTDDRELGSKNLWAPWRMAYIRGMSDAASPTGCFFCDYWITPAADAEHYVVARRPSSMALLNRFPYTNGHVLICCSRHCGRFSDLNEGELLDMTLLTRDVVSALEKIVQAQGFNVGMNLGRCAGAGFPDHLHTHVVPRWNGDTNYMPVIADTRVINDSLESLYHKLRESL